MVGQTPRSSMRAPLPNLTSASLTTSTGPTRHYSKGSVLRSGMASGRGSSPEYSRSNSGRPTGAHARRDRTELLIMSPAAVLTSRQATSTRLSTPAQFGPRRRHWYRAHDAQALLVLALAAVIGMIFTYRDAAHSTSQLHFTTFWASMLVGLGVAVLAGVYSRDERSLAPCHTNSLRDVHISPKFMMSVNSPVYYDEFGQWRRVNDLLRTGNLFPGEHVPTGPAVLPGPSHRHRPCARHHQPFDIAQR